MKKIKKLLCLVMIVLLMVPSVIFAEASAPARTQVLALNETYVGVQFSNGYLGYCIDATLGWSESEDGKNQYYAMDATFASKNVNGVPTDEDISQPLKALFTQEFDSVFTGETLEDGTTEYYIDSYFASSALQSAIWNISDDKYTYGEGKTLADNAKAYDGPAIPDHGYQVTTENGDVVTFHFMVMRPVDPALGIQDFFSYKIDVNAPAKDAAAWEKSETDHWKECECGVRFDVAQHIGGEATCTTKAVCKTCGLEYGTVDPDNHNWGEGVTTDPTCTEDGYTIYTCEEDKEHIKKVVDENSATGHVELTKTDEVDAKCETDGNIEYYTCKCGKLFTDKNAENEITAEKTVVTKQGHDYKDEVTKQPTCIEAGVRTYTCTHDKNHTYTELILATGEHTGGVATETERAVCEVCMQPYGEFAPAAEDNSDETEGKLEEGTTEENGEESIFRQEPEVDPVITPSDDPESDADASPQTSDDFQMGFWLAVTMISLAACAALVVFRSKRETV